MGEVGNNRDAQVYNREMSCQNTLGFGKHQGGQVRRVPPLDEKNPVTTKVGRELPTWRKIKWDKRKTEEWQPASTPLKFPLSFKEFKFHANQGNMTGQKRQRSYTQIL